MPIHDWSKIEAGIFHAFHHGWIAELARAMNRGLLPPDYYALPEQVAAGWGPDVLTLQRPTAHAEVPEPEGGVLLQEAPPKVQSRILAEIDWYAGKAKSVVVRHSSNHRVIAVMEIVSPGNKNGRHGVRAFVDKAIDLIRRGVHLLVLDVLPPTRRVSLSMHAEIWQALSNGDTPASEGGPLMLASYLAGSPPEAFLETKSVGDPLIDMPLFLSLDVYVNVPLEQTYAAAFEALPAYWRQQLAE